MKKLFCILILTASAFGSTTVTGNLKNLGTGNVTSTSGAFVRFWLRGCRGNQPRITGTGAIAPQFSGNTFYFDIPADGAGNVSGTLYSTRDAAGTGDGDIECGGSHTAVWYGMQVINGSIYGPEFPIHAKSGATLDISNVTPNTTQPVVNAPTGDTTYARIDGGNTPFTGPITAKKINSVRFSDQYPVSTISAPSVNAGIASGSTGGTVAANTYACQVTYNGAAGGETTPSPGSSTVTTSGATSVLWCLAGDEPAGASSYNVYWQTGGSGSYWKGHTNVSFSVADQQTVTPPISGTNPPSSNTATGLLAGAVSDLGSNPGAIFIPSTVSSGEGQIGDLEAGQTVLDFRSGSLYTKCQNPSSQKTPQQGQSLTCWSFDHLIPSALSAFQGVNSFNVGIHAEDTPSYSFAPPLPANYGPSNNFAVASTFSATRSGSRTEPIWAGNYIAQCNNNLAQCTGLEINVNNAGAGPYAGNSFDGNGLMVLVGGLRDAFIGLQLGNIGTAKWTDSLWIDDTYRNAGIHVYASSGSTPGILMDTKSAGGVSRFNWNDNGVLKWVLTKDNSHNFAFIDKTTGSEQTRIQMNAGADTFIGGSGGGKVSLNTLAGMGTGGLEVGSGGGSPSVVATVDSTGKGTFNNGVAPSPNSDAITWFKKVTHASLDLASLASGQCSSAVTETVTGAALGDSCTVTAATGTADGSWYICNVQTDAVKWSYCNMSGGAQDRASDTYTIRVMR